MKLYVFDDEIAALANSVQEARELLEPLCCNTELRALIHESMPRVIMRPTAIVRWGSMGGSQLFSALPEGRESSAAQQMQSNRNISPGDLPRESESTPSRLQESRMPVDCRL